LPDFTMRTAFRLLESMTPELHGARYGWLPHDGRDVAGRLKTALPACLADPPDCEDEVRPEERADTGSRDVFRLKIDHGSPTEDYEAARVHYAHRRAAAWPLAARAQQDHIRPHRVPGR